MGNNVAHTACILHGLETRRMEAERFEGMAQDRKSEDLDYSGFSTFNSNSLSS